MSRKTVSAIRIIAVLLVLMAVLMQLQIVIIPAIAGYKFWMVTIAFGMVILTGR